MVLPRVMWVGKQVLAQLKSPSELLCTMADSIEASAHVILADWEQRAAEVLQTAGDQQAEAALDRVIADGKALLSHLPARLRTDPLAPRRPHERRAYAMGGAALRSPESVISLALGYRLQLAFIELVWEVVAPHLPKQCDAAAASRAHADLGAAVGRILGATPVELVDAAERTFQARQRALSEGFARMLSAQEEERRRIARHVHDVVAQALASARLRTDTALRLIQKDAERAGREALEARQLLDLSLSQVRDIAYNLRPMTLDRFGLRAALEEYAARLQEDHEVQITVTGNCRNHRLGTDTETSLFRIAQAILGAIATLRGVHSAQVYLDVTERGATLAVECDGRVLASPDKRRSQGGQVGGLDLLTMREHAALLGGHMAVSHRSGRGTRLEVTVPMGSEGAQWNLSRS